jgi:hypothetical protein
VISNTENKMPATAAARGVVRRALVIVVSRSKYYSSIQVA